jgi:SIR2-like domain
MYNPDNIFANLCLEAGLLLIDAARNRRAMDQLLALLRTGQPYAMTGAGVSVWAGYRIWRQVIDQLAAAVTELRGAEVDVALIVKNHQDLLFCAQNLGRALSREQFAEFVRQEFGPNGKPLHELLYLLAQMPFRHMLTLNFDLSVERAHLELKLQCGTVSCCDRSAISRFVALLDSQEHPRQIVHLHGIYTDPVQNVALTEEAYRQLYHDNHLFKQFLWLLAATKRMVFFGFGFGDTDFLNAMREAARDVHENGNRHFAIVGIAPAEDDGPVRQQLNERFLVEPIFYELVEDGGDRHARFPPLINGISHELALPVRRAFEIAEPAVAAEPIAEPGDLQRAVDLAEQFLRRTDPGANDA